MTFATDVYPHRTNRTNFVNQLLARIDREWTKVVTDGYSHILPGGVNRKTITPVWIDKTRIKALLAAWSMKIPDRYLDLQAVGKVRPQSTFDATYAFLRRNASRGGGVCFVRHELENCGTGQRISTVFFGERLFKNWSYNAYFSAMLGWDDRSCFGLIRKLQVQTQTEVLGGGSATNNVWRAARKWVVQNKLAGVYRAYNIKLT